MTAAQTPGLRPAWRIPCICILLAALTFSVFGRTIRHEFINYDDNLYVYDNPLVTAGLTARGILEVFTHYETRFYTPLTMISHMADCQLYGLRAGGHHLTNVLLHTATAILLFLVLVQMTGAVWRAAFVAALFAIHPLHVESVAWVAERNDVLGGLFFVLTIGAYVRYARRPASLSRYLLVVALFILGLLSKPTLVTLPFVLLLLDYWPLARFAQPPGPGRNARLVAEKIPLMALSLAAALAAYFAEGKSVASLQTYSVSSRISNALVSSVVYLGQMLWPVNLAVFYPRPAGGPAPVEITLAISVLVCISTVAFMTRRTSPWFAAGWLWYLVVLAPVIGLVQVGEFAHADRYTYLSQIGLYLAVAWGAAELFGRLRLPRRAPCIAAALVIGAYAACSVSQVSHWRDSESLFRHALECTSGNYVACNNLGQAVQKDRPDEAIALYEKGLGFRPWSVPLNNSLARALVRQGRMEEAIPYFQKVAGLQPGSARVHHELGDVFLHLGDSRAAITEWRRCLEIQPRDKDALTSIAWVLATCVNDSLRNGPEAVELARQAEQISGGGDPLVLRTLAAAHAEAGDFAAAKDAARRAAQFAEARGDAALAETVRREMVSYEAERPLRGGM